MLLPPFLASCQVIRSPDYRGECGAGDLRPWVLAEPSPTDRSLILAAAEAHALEDEIKAYPYSVDSWFTLPSGEVMLCRSAGPLRDAPGGKWWQFEKGLGGWRVISNYCWGCVVVTS